MGKKIIPPQDPARLARMQDERLRMMGIELEEIEKQARERKEAEAAAARSKEEEDARQLEWARQVEIQHTEASIRRRYNATRVADCLKDQVDEKKQRDETLRQVYQNQVKDEFFNQFGTSHR